MRSGKRPQQASQKASTLRPRHGASVVIVQRAKELGRLSMPIDLMSGDLTSSVVFINSLLSYAVSFAFSHLLRYSVSNEFSIRVVAYSGLCHNLPKANAPGSNSAIGVMIKIGTLHYTLRSKRHIMVSHPER